MKPVPGKQLARALERQGWILQRVSGSHHVYAKTGHPARISIPIHGNTVLKLGLQHYLMKLAGLAEGDL